MPLPFEPRPGPIDLSRVSSEAPTVEDRETRHNPTGPINLFTKKTNQFGSKKTVKKTQTVIEEGDRRIEGGIWAPTEPEEFEFDWPSEEIKEACEALFAKDDGSILPALNWIPVEEKNNSDNDEMQDVQEHR